MGDSSDATSGGPRANTSLVWPGFGASWTDQRGVRWSCATRRMRFLIIIHCNCN